MIHQWKYSLYKYQHNTSENRDSVIKPYLFKINMYNIYILDSSRNEYVQVMYRYLKQFSITENAFAVQVSINNICINFFSEMSVDSLKSKAWDILSIG